MKKKTLRSSFNCGVAEVKRSMDTMEYTPALTELLNLKTSRGRSSNISKRVPSHKMVVPPNLCYPSNPEGIPMFI
ncbi:hypothetical protein PM10SUCC1_11440 [Propionigenium maris DSM 9537]|uniref:Uncharacterized protein n=1 Tax=Propionigenium maris DSM 9537 TaxID=1123000 RepID=A0A9W6GK47_9FUSO|nr:hypothetical protein [Propionigenium maris]GLI55630.1 hypothetical protein PM10SUCC1_11440 [Propionigenium maris DSM 9537]